jgi:hypothetical protein
MLSKHRFVAPYEPSKATMQGIPQRYPRFVGFLHKKENSWLKVDFINVAASVTGSVGLVSLLWHHGATLVHQRMPSLYQWFIHIGIRYF